MGPRDNLQNETNKRFNTALIGALDRFESHFGQQWGHGSKEKTEEQKIMEKVWQECRKDILDFGNKQRRIAEKNIEKYEVRGTNNKIIFTVGKDKR